MRTQYSLILMALDQRWRMVSFLMPLAVEFSVVIGVGSFWVHFISLSVVRMTSPYFALAKMPPTSASAAEDMTLLRIPTIDSPAPLCISGSLGFA